MSDRDPRERPTLWRTAYALPNPAHTLYGRDRELAELQEVLDHGARSITLTGPAGIGKTRLAIELAHRNATGDRLAAFLRLDPLRDAAMVPKLLATVCALDGWPDLSIERFPKDLEGVLVLDGFDHLHDAGISILTLQERCPHLLVIVTSREAVQLPDETVVPLAPIGVAAAGEMLETSGGRDHGDSAAMVRLLALADGNPLALELLSAQSLAGNLCDIEFAGDGHLTLPELIDVAIGSLDPEARRLFERLCVCAAGLEANLVQPLADCAPRVDGEIARHIAKMTQLGLIRTHSTEILAARFEIPTAIREVGLARSSASGELADFRLAYASHMLHRAAGVRDLLAGARRNAALAWFEREYAGLRLAFGTFVQLNRVQQARTLAIALVPYWLLRRRFREARRWLKVALELTGAPHTDDVEQELLVASGLMELYCGNLAAARSRSLAGARPGMPAPQSGWRGAALATLGMLAAQDRDYDRAIGLYRVYLEASRSARDGAVWTPQLRTLTRLALTAAYFARGEMEEAEYQATMALKRGLGLGDPLLVGYARLNLAAVATAKADLETSLELYRDGILLLIDQPHLSAGSAGMLGLARLALQMKAFDIASRLVELARSLLQYSGPIPPYLISFDPDELQVSLADAQRKRLGDTPVSGSVTSLTDVSAIVGRMVDELAAAPTIPTRASGREERGGLSHREHEVLCLACKDMTDLEIADALFISRRTSSDHMRNVIGKLGVNSRTGAVARALREGWCD